MQRGENREGEELDEGNQRLLMTVAYICYVGGRALTWHQEGREEGFNVGGTFMNGGEGNPREKHNWECNAGEQWFTSARETAPGCAGGVYSSSCMAVVV